MAVGVMPPPGFLSPAAFAFLPPWPGAAQQPASVPVPSTKVSGLGDNFYVGGYDLSGDIQALGKIGGGPALLDVTDITQLAHSRLGGERDGGIDYVSYFDPTTAHPVLSLLPRTDVIETYCRGTAVGNPAACLNAKQVDYNPTRANDGSITFAISSLSNGYGLEWGVQLTPGLRTDVAATAGPAVDGGGATSFGFQAYLQMTGFTGTDVTVKLQDSGDGVTFADLASGAFTQTTAANTFQRIAVGGTPMVRRFVKATTVTSAGFTSATFNVVFVRNVVATVF